jgi:cobaltochelatase CobT
MIVARLEELQMAEREPAAFFSYVRSDDTHDLGRISELRQNLEGEVKMQTGHAFHIFQDRNDISWGEQWKEQGSSRCPRLANM